MYRILIAPLAQRLLRTLPEPLLSRVGHVMAKAADEVAFDGDRSAAARSGAAGRTPATGPGRAHATAGGAHAAGTGRGSANARTGPAGGRERLAKLEVEGLALTYAIDPVKHTLTVRRIAQV